MRSLASNGRSPAASFLWSAFGVAATLMAAGCAGGGCTSSCAGSSVIPGGFPKEGRVTNSAGVRLTRTGLDFLEQNVGALAAKLLGASGPLTFPIPTSHPSFSILITTITADVCPDGPKPTGSPPECIVEIDLTGITGPDDAHKNPIITATGPHDINLSARLPVRLQRLPVHALGATSLAALGEGGDGSKYVKMPVTADISLETVPDDATHKARAGYTRINIKKLEFDKDLLNSSISLKSAGGVWDTIFTALVNALKGVLLPALTGGLTSSLTAPLSNATCMKENVLPDGTKQCPKDTFDVGGTCRYGTKDTDECVPMLLGIESRFDLSGLLASLSPGTSGGLDFMLASGGDMSPAPGTDVKTNGVTLSMFGGGEPFPVSNCVPTAPNPLPTGIVLPDELSANTITPWAEPAPPHLGIGLAERYLNHAATAAYNSGLFCIGISSEQIPQLDAGLFKLLLPSLDGLSEGFSAADSHPSMGLAIRPQKPPTITVGDNTADFKSPLLDLNLKDTDLDFYVWSEERFIRIFTGRIDIEVPINLEAGKDGLAIKLPPKNPISFKNPRITNNNILLEDDTKVGKLVESIGGLIPTSALSAIKPFKLDSALASLGLTLTIPPDGIRKLTKGTDNFLSIFATLGVATSATPTARTTAEITKYTVDAASLSKLETFGDHPVEVMVHGKSDLDDGTHEVEYAYKVDGGTWTTFEKGADFTVTSPFFLLQGKHTIFVTSRVVGVANSEGEPYQLPIILDVGKPIVRIQPGATNGLVKVTATDQVSLPSTLAVEFRLDSGEWTKVPVDMPATISGKMVEQLVRVPETAASIEVRVTDESGNIGQTSSPLIRGRADPSLPAKSGCGCSIPGADDSNGTTPVGVLAGLGALGAVLERRRRRTRAQRVAGGLAASSLMVLSAGASGCSCGNSNTETPSSDTGNDAKNGTKTIPTYVIGGHTSAAKSSDGKIWIAGYFEGDPSTGQPDDFKGDLVVGQWDGSKVSWVAVDGVPAVAPDPDYDSTGFRGGILDPGDNVGQYTSMVLDSKGNPIVAYYDKTNGGLRVATYDGNKWSTHSVESKSPGWAGRWTSMVMAGGKPVIAYQTLEKGTGGAGKAKVRIARASSEAPQGTGDWSTEDVVVDDKGPCIQAICGSGEKCLVGDATAGVGAVCAATTSGCDASCADVCTKNSSGKPACLKAAPALGGFVNAIGSYNSLAVTPSGDLGLVFYDRTKGNLRAASSKGGKWTVTPATAPLDGWTGDAAKDAKTGDRGVAATLAIDSTGNWHVAYVDGIKEWVLYAFVPGGDLTKPITPVVIDDGTTSDGTTKFTDGQHLVGDDASIVVNGTNVTIVYQDSTAGTLHWAKATGGPTAKFTRGVVKQDGLGGFWPTIIDGQVANFYRMKGTTAADEVSGTPGDPVILGNVRLVALP